MRFNYDPLIAVIVVILLVIGFVLGMQDLFSSTDTMQYMEVIGAKNETIIS